MSDTTRVVENRKVDNLKTVYTAAANEGENQVLNAVVTNPNGDVLEHKDVYPSLNKLTACGGDQKFLKANITGTLKSKGTDTPCTGSAIIIAK